MRPRSSDRPPPGLDPIIVSRQCSAPGQGAAPPTSFQPGLPADRVDAHLREAVRELENAEHRAVLWFADMNARRLYRDLGYASMRQYATCALGFSRTRAADFIRLAARLDELPRIRDSIAAGELGYTKARELVKVASPDTEQHWLDAATSASRRDLEARVKRVQQRAQRRRKARTAAQPELMPTEAAARANPEPGATARTGDEDASARPAPRSTPRPAPRSTPRPAPATPPGSSTTTPSPTPSRPPSRCA